MRVFYIFNIKNEFKYLYKETPSLLYGILKQIYCLEKEDILYGKNIYNQIVDKTAKDEIDKYLFIRLHQDMPYSKRGDIHYINNLYKDEVSRLIAKNTYIKIETESGFSSFFNYLGDFNNNFFACCFETLDFFWLDSIKTLV